MHKVALGLIGGGSIFLSLSLVLGWLGLPHVIRSQVKKATRLRPGSEIYDIWREAPFPVYLKFHFFNVINPEDIISGEKPIVKEMGPYTYLEKLKKEDIQVGSSNSTLVYRQTRAYFFKSELSQGSEEDMLTFLNIPFVGVAKMANLFKDTESIHSELDSKLNAAGESLFKTATIRDFLFDGLSIKPYLDVMRDPALEAIGEFKIPKRFLDGKFALYEGRNGSDDGVFEVKTGNDDYREFGEIVQWNNLTTLPWWKGKTCNAINGTDGSIFKPFLTRKSVLLTYNLEVCRTIFAVYEKDIKFKGIPLYRFTVADKIFQGKQNNPDNACYCTEKDESLCERDGLLIMSGCADGGPVVLSSPHFYGAQQSLIDAIDGMNPDEAKHKTYMDLEPVTAVTVRAAKRFQFNIDVTPYVMMPSFAKLRKMAFPIMWTEEFVELPDSYLKIFTQLYTALEILDTGKWTLVSLSLGILGLGIICAIFKKDNSGMIKQ